MSQKPGFSSFNKAKKEKQPPRTTLSSKRKEGTPSSPGNPSSPGLTVPSGSSSARHISKDGNSPRRRAPLLSESQDKKGSDSRQYKPISKDNEVQNAKGDEANKKSKSSRSNGDDSCLATVRIGPVKAATEHVESKDTGMKKANDTIFSDNSKLSILVRRVTNTETSKERRLDSVRSLKDYLKSLHYTKEVAKNGENLLNVLYNVICESKSLNEAKCLLVDCLVITAHILGQNATRFFQLIFSKLQLTPSDETKIHLMTIVSKALKEDCSKQDFKLLTSMLMKNLQKVLENIFSADLLVPSLDAIGVIASGYPDVFAPYFRETVDIVVGWHIDSTQKNSVIDACSDILVILHEFWVADLAFSTTLLGQFLEDIEGYAEDFVVEDSASNTDIPPPEVCKTKILELMRVFSTVMQALGTNFTPAQGPPITEGYIVEIFRSLIVCVNITQQSRYDRVVTFHANQCLLLLCECVQTNLSIAATDLLKHATVQLKLLLENHLTFGKPLNILLDIIQIVFECCTRDISPGIILGLIGPQSVVHQLRYQPTNMYLPNLVTFYRALLSIKNIPSLEAVYNCMLSDLEMAYKKLLKLAGSTANINIVKNNCFSDVEYTEEKAKIAVILNLSALSKIASTKSSIIGMWALSPNVFDLCTHHLSLPDWKIAEHFPSVHFSLLLIIFTHCESHGHFVTSCLPRVGGMFDSSLMAGSTSKTSGYLENILQLLADILPHPSLSFDSRLLSVKWMFSLADSFKQCKELHHIFTFKKFHASLEALLPLAYHVDENVCIGVGQCLIKFFECGQLPLEFMQRCFEVTKAMIVNCKPTVRAVYHELMSVIPADIISRFEVSPLSHVKKLSEGQQIESCFSEEDCQGVQAIRLAKQKHMNKSYNLTFSSQDFKIIMAYLLMGRSPEDYDGDNWLEEMYFANQRHQESHDGAKSLAESNMEQNEGIQWFWATWEVAQYCVHSKLKTPIGKPQDTFRAIDSVLKEYSDHARNGRETAIKAELLGTSNYENVLRPRLLLQFLEHLEKLMYNSYEGCAIAMPSASKTVKTFFRTNRNSVQDWLKTIRPLALDIALHCKHYACALRHGLELLNTLKSTGSSNVLFDEVLQKVVTALIMVRCPDNITGLVQWSSKYTSNAYTWIDAATSHAEGRYEAAALDYMDCLKRHLQLDEKGGEKMMRRFPKLMDLTSSTGNSYKTNKEEAQPKKILTRLSEAIPTPNQGVVEFMVHQVATCYSDLCDWKSVMLWQETINELHHLIPSQVNKSGIYQLPDVNVIKALSKFEEHDFESVSHHLDLIPGCSLAAPIKLSNWQTSWNPDNHRTQSLLELIRGMTHMHTTGCAPSDVHTVQEELLTVNKLLDNNASLADDCCRIACLEWPSLGVSQENTLRQCQRLLKNIYTSEDKDQKIPFSEAILQSGIIHNINVFHTSLVMSQYQEFLNSSSGTKGVKKKIAKLHLATAKIARKHSNYSMALKHLMSQADLVNNTEVVPNIFNMEIQNSNNKHSQPLLLAMQTLHEQDTALIDVLQLKRETAKLLHNMGQKIDACELLVKAIVKYAPLVSTGMVVGHELAMLADLNSRSLLNLVKWFVGDYKTATFYLKQSVSSSPSNTISQNLKLLIDMEYNGASLGFGVSTVASGLSDQLEAVGCSPAISETDAVCGKLLHLSTMQAPTLSKAWSSLASWCYRWGRKAVDIASSEGGVPLLHEEETKLMYLLPAEVTNDVSKCIMQIVSQAHCSATTIQEEDIAEQMQSPYHDGRETVRKQLINVCPILEDSPPHIIEGLLEVWQFVCRRIFSQYRLAANSYFTYLKLSAGVVDKDSNVTPKENDKETDAEETNEDSNITATLRLLRLLVKYASELRDVLENGLASTPTVPWKGIIPQLFSRLNHPEAYVRQSISDLLCRVAKDSPHLIVYQAVVGCPSSAKDNLENGKEVLPSLIAKSPSKATTDVLEDEDAEMYEEEREKSMVLLEDCFLAIVDTLSKHNPTLVSHIELMIRELRRITILWDELWLGTLNQLHLDVTRRLSTIDDEAKKVESNSSLSKDEKKAIIWEKYKAFMKPIIYALEQVQTITNKVAETPNEQAFQDNFKESISKALDSLQHPENPSNPYISWTPFKQLHAVLQQRATRKSTFMLHMEDISTKLAALKGTPIPLPGLVCHPMQVVTIDKFASLVTILPTKTKPKKLLIHGGDGKKYAYLFKGLEDLHLDERIMQFLAIVNTMFAKSKRHETPLYHACYYSVTPLGPRSGLIQWVDGATPLFGLYKRWQQREAAAQAMKNSNQAISHNVVARPSEIYYNKLNPILKEKGMSEQTARKDWPIAVVKTVLQELIQETPGDLLAKELWCCSSSASEWWAVTQAYSRSTAVMSIIGYIIGLGDRHLDNVLVNFMTGDVVHIDYNVSFEKGKNLRVPERVPFRMTQNVEQALGVTGIEGLFRQSSEDVLKIMRKGRETLLTLLEAFVYDPLVDWTTGNEGGFASAFYGGGLMNPVIANRGQSKREMQREITRSLFSSHVAEVKGSWFKNRDDMLAALALLSDDLSIFIDAVQEIHGLEEIHRSLEFQREYVMAAQSDKAHSLHTLGQRYIEFLGIEKKKTESLGLIRDKICELERWHSQHKIALDTTRGRHLAIMVAEMDKKLQLNPTFHAAAVAVMKNAGQGQVISQCEVMEGELNGLLTQRRVGIKACLQTLQTYASMITTFPKNFSEMNRAYVWLCWLQDLMPDFNFADVEKIIVKFHARYSQANEKKMSEILLVESKLHHLMLEANKKMVHATEKAALTDSVNVVKIEEAKHSVIERINAVVQEHGDAGVYSMRAVVMNALCSFNRRSLIMEGAVAGAGDHLVDFTSRNGNWFLDEICTMLSNVQFILSLMQQHQPTNLEISTSMFKAVDTFKASKQVFESLHDLYAKFKTVILPETIKNIQSDDSSLTLLFTSISELCDHPDIHLMTSLRKLDQALSSISLGMQIDDLSIHEEMLTLRSAYNDLLQVNPQDQQLSMGQTLLTVINGLFESLEFSLSNFINHLDAMTIPREWRKLDVIQEARALQMSVVNGKTKQLLSDVFFIRKLQTVHVFFNKCHNFTSFLNGEQSPVTSNQSDPAKYLISEDHLIKSVKKFVAEFVRKQILGIPSQVIGYTTCTLIEQFGVNTIAEINAKDVGANFKVNMEHLCKKAMDSGFQSGVMSQHVYNNLNSLIVTAEGHWKAADSARQNADSNTAKECAQRARLQLARFQWLQEDVLLQANSKQQHSIPKLSPTRTEIMSEMRKRVLALSGMESNISTVNERFLQVQTSIAQRLKWAAGANPALTGVMKLFESSLNNRLDVTNLENKRSNEVIGLCNAILHFEALRTRTSEAVNADTHFRTTLTKCCDSIAIVEKSKVAVSHVEQSLLTLKPIPKDETIGKKWLRGMNEILKQHLSETKEKVAQHNDAVSSAKETLSNQVDMVKNCLSTHHKLMSDFKHLLKALARDESEDEEDGEGAGGAGGVKLFMAEYKSFSEAFTTMIKILIVGTSEDKLDKVNQLAKLLVNIQNLTEETRRLYDDLVGLAAPLTIPKALDEPVSDKSPPSFASALRNHSKDIEQENEQVQEEDKGSSEKVVKAADVKDKVEVKGCKVSGQEGTGASPSTSPVVKQVQAPRQPTTVMRDPRTGKMLQVRNTHAINVWRRVKGKLDGRDPDPTRRCTVQEQVDHVIAEATSMENLATLYEGWTAWV
ncbi:serine/threonine-protein kinase SMG1-like [Antedon mediterranea]|uniref:serine/threonine-protein kinase SMG1-like n=1 Tax=Antedon mediterranea TaxID=105859 RepID=UPI003AF70BB5